MTTKVMTVTNKPIFAYYTGGRHGCTNVRDAISTEVSLVKFVCLVILRC